jgi:hypothetical protein
LQARLEQPLEESKRLAALFVQREKLFHCTVDQW